MNNSRGIALMVVAMAFFAVEDAFLKQAAQSMPIAQIMALVGAGATLVYVGLGWRKGYRFLSREVLIPAVVLRNLCEMISTLGYMIALASMPLANAAAILQASPLVITLGAALFLGEKVGWRRWTAMVVGFIGVLIVIRPGTEGFNSASIWAVSGTVALAARDLLTRRVPPNMPTEKLAGWAFASVTLVGLALLGLRGGAVMPDAAGIGTLLICIAFGSAGYGIIVAAVRIGDMSAIAPFRYTRLMFMIVLGALFFHEVPDRWMLIGSALVVGSGLYTLNRERRLRRLARAAAVQPAP